MSKLCQNCKDRGVCCKAFYLNDDQPPWAFKTIEDKAQTEERLKNKNLPFRIIGRTKYHWVFGCNCLSAEGFCTIYKNRPAVCKKYRPGCGLLCCYSKRFSPINMDNIEKV